MYKIKNYFKKYFKKDSLFINKNISFLKKKTKYIYMLDIFNGIYIIYKNFYTKKVTLNYPFECASLGNRFRGEHVLRYYDNGFERCIICKLCEVICPAAAITIDASENDLIKLKVNNINEFIDTNTEIKRESIKYDIDMTKCIFCGYCQEACPVEAVVESSNYNYSTILHEELLYDKYKLLENGILNESEVAYNLKINEIFR